MYLQKYKATAEYSLFTNNHNNHIENVKHLIYNPYRIQQVAMNRSYRFLIRVHVMTFLLTVQFLSSGTMWRYERVSGCTKWQTENETATTPNYLLRFFK